MRASTSDLVKSTCAGALAGVAASFLMTRFQVAMSGRGLSGSENPQSNKPVNGRGDDAAMKAADVASRATTGEPLTREERTEVGGPAAHYAFGAIVGAVYGALRELMPDSAFASGGVFGASVWLVADQLALPLSGLTPWPLEAYPPETNAQHFAAHQVYGTTLAATYPIARRLFA